MPYSEQIWPFHKPFLVFVQKNENSNRILIRKTQNPEMCHFNKKTQFSQKIGTPVVNSLLENSKAQIMNKT